MNDKLEFKDFIEMEDSVSPKGFVVLKDKSGKILVSKKNMIVRCGRNFIFNLFLNSMLKSGIIEEENKENIKIYHSNNLSSAFMLDGYNLTKIAFGSGDKETEFSDESLSNILESYVFELNKDEDKVGIEYGVSNGHPYIKFDKEIVVSSSGSIDSFCELGLYLTKGEDTNEDILFSRIKFDRIPISAGVEFKLEYYIYF